MGDLGSILWVMKIPWRREWLPTPVFLPEEFYELRSLAGYSPCGHKESDTTEQLTLSLFLFFQVLQREAKAENMGERPVLGRLHGVYLFTK